MNGIPSLRKGRISFKGFVVVCVLVFGGFCCLFVFSGVEGAFGRCRERHFFSTQTSSKGDNWGSGYPITLRGKRDSSVKRTRQPVFKFAWFESICLAEVSGWVDSTGKVSCVVALLITLSCLAANFQYLVDRSFDLFCKYCWCLQPMAPILHPSFSLPPLLLKIPTTYWHLTLKTSP